MRKGLRFGFALVMLLLGGVMLLSQTTLTGETRLHREALLGVLETKGDGQRLEPGVLAISHAGVEPTTINMMDVPAGYPNGYITYGERVADGYNLQEPESTRSEFERETLRQDALSLPVDPDIQLGSQAVAQRPLFGVTFDSLDFNDTEGYIPPDPDIAVGPNHVLGAVNTSIEIYDKTGASLMGPLSIASIFSGVTDCEVGGFLEVWLFTDPNVLYDEKADRFIIGVDRFHTDLLGLNILPGSYYCVAVSATNDPTGLWHVYSFQTDASNPDNVFLDFPQAGIGNNALYMGGNLFETGATSEIDFVEGRLWQFDKQAMYDGLAATYMERGLGIDEDTPQPLHLHGFNDGTWLNNGKHYFLANSNANGRDYAFMEWRPNGNLFIVNRLDFDVETGVVTSLPVNMPQQGGSDIAGNDFRTLDLEFRNGSAWVVQHIGCNPGGGTVNCLRWLELDIMTGTVIQSGVYADDDVYRAFPDIAVNACETMMISYSRFTPTDFPSAFVTGRKGNDPLNTLRGELTVKAGELTYVSFAGDGPPLRWGDYLGATPDPNGSDIWVIGQYSKDTTGGILNVKWGTFIAQLTPPCNP